MKHIWIEFGDDRVGAYIKGYKDKHNVFYRDEDVHGIPCYVATCYGVRIRSSNGDVFCSFEEAVNMVEKQIERKREQHEHEVDLKDEQRGIIRWCLSSQDQEESE